MFIQMMKELDRELSMKILNKMVFNFLFTFTNNLKLQFCFHTKKVLLFMDYFSHFQIELRKYIFKLNGKLQIKK